MRRAMWKHLSKLGSHFSFCMLRIIQVLHCQIPPAPQALRAALVISKKAYTVRLQTLHLRSYLVSPLPRNPLTITQALMEASCSPRHPDTSTTMENASLVLMILKLLQLLGGHLRQSRIHLNLMRWPKFPIPAPRPMPCHHSSPQRTITASHQLSRWNLSRPPKRPRLP